MKNFQVFYGLALMLICTYFFLPSSHAGKQDRMAQELSLEVQHVFAEMPTQDNVPDLAELLRRLPLLERCLSTSFERRTRDLVDFKRRFLQDYMKLSKQSRDEIHSSARQAKYQEVSNHLSYFQGLLDMNPYPELTNGHLERLEATLKAVLSSSWSYVLMPMNEWVHRKEDEIDRFAPLMLAAMLDLPEALSLVLENGHGRLVYFKKKEFLEAVTEMSHPERVVETLKKYKVKIPLAMSKTAALTRFLLLSGSEVDGTPHHTDDKKHTALHAANNEEVAQVLIDTLTASGKSVDLLTEQKRTPLSFARNKRIASALLYRGADVNALDAFHRTPLHWQAQEGNEEILSVLIAAGGEVNLADEKGHIPLHYAETEATVKLLIDAGSNVNALTADVDYPEDNPFKFRYSPLWSSIEPLVRHLFDREITVLSLKAFRSGSLMLTTEERKGVERHALEIETAQVPEPVGLHLLLTAESRLDAMTRLNYVNFGLRGSILIYILDQVATPGGPKLLESLGWTEFNYHNILYWIQRPERNVQNLGWWIPDNEKDILNVDTVLEIERNILNHPAIQRISQEAAFVKRREILQLWDYSRHP